MWAWAGLVGRRGGGVRLTLAENDNSRVLINPPTGVSSVHFMQLSRVWLLNAYAHVRHPSGHVERVVVERAGASRNLKDNGGLAAQTNKLQFGNGLLSDGHMTD